MIKIYEMKIRGIKPFEDRVGDFKFGPFLNLIRGHNGAGKTTVQEALALLGHCSILKVNNDKFHEEIGCEITYTLFLDYDIAIKGFLDKLCKLNPLRSAWEKVFSEGAQKKEAKKIRVKIYPEDERIKDDLKTWLTEEKLLENAWCITGENADEVELLRQLVAFSRPRQEKNEEQSFKEKVQSIIQNIETIEIATNSIVAAKEDAQPTYTKPPRVEFLGQYPLPPYICYFNSDMYKWGIGLDIRESPKHLKKELAGLLRHRLFLVDDTNEVKNFDLLQKFWEKIFEGEREKVGILKSLKFEKDDAKPIVGEGGKDDSDRQFLSSGENQALALGIILRVLQPQGAVIILDEPDLHLSLPSAVRMYNFIYAECINENTQIIAVSHLPFVFSNSLHEDDLLNKEEGFFALWKNPKDQKFNKKALTLFFLEKNGKLVDCYRQSQAAEKAGEYQNKEIESVLRQARKEFRWKSVFFKFKAS
jgi:energy-coupling factor transporter ATP-binding protein EcfA2